jgi:hypothetical protein
MMSGILLAVGSPKDCDVPPGTVFVSGQYRQAKVSFPERPAVHDYPTAS